MSTNTEVWDDNSRTVYTYDENGNQTRMTDYESSGRVTSDCFYQNNDRGQVVGWRVFDGSEQLIRRFEVDYDLSGREEESREFDGNGTLIRRERHIYDSLDRETEVQHYDSQGILRSKAILERDQNGSYLRTIYCDPEGRPLRGPAA